MINKDELKASLNIQEVISIVNYFHGDPIQTNFGLTCLTICHNHPEDSPSRKLYYYENTHLFKCFTQCNDIFDIFELVIKCYENQYGERIELPKAISIVLRLLGKTYREFETKENLQKDELDKIMNRILEDNDISLSKDLKVYKTTLLDHLNTLRILDWEKEGISYNTLLKYNIKYFPPTAQIVIPHYNKKGGLIGIRGRTLIKEDAEKYGKYRPLIVDNIMYNHPLGMNLYGLNQTKEAIVKTKTAIIFESEKSVLMMDSYFGEYNNSVAVCGSVISREQCNELIELGVTELVFAFDRQYKEFNDDECLKWYDKINNMVIKYSLYFKISVIFDKEHLIGYKDSPIDRGKEIFLELYKKRFIAKYE